MPVRREEVEIVDHRMVRRSGWVGRSAGMEGLDTVTDVAKGRLWPTRAESDGGRNAGLLRTHRRPIPAGRWGRAPFATLPTPGRYRAAGFTTWFGFGPFRIANYTEVLDVDDGVMLPKGGPGH